MRFSLALQQLSGVFEGRLNYARCPAPANDNAGIECRFLVERDLILSTALGDHARDHVKASAERAFFRDDMPAYRWCLEVLRSLDQEMLQRPC